MPACPSSVGSIAFVAVAFALASCAPLDDDLASQRPASSRQASDVDGDLEVARGKPALASSSESAALGPSNAVDASDATRWASAEGADPQWLRVDLGQRFAVTRVVLRWEAAYARAYRVELSNDGSSWQAVYATNTGDGGSDDRIVNGVGRYVRVLGSVRGTQWGYSLYTLAVHGRPSASPVDAGSPMPPSDIAHGARIDSTNTGVPAAVALTRYDGTLDVRTAGALVEKLDIHGMVRVSARDVTLRNCRIRGVGNYYPLQSYAGGANLRVEHTTITGSAPVGAPGDIACVALSAPAHIYRSNIGDGCGDGIRPASGTVVEESFIHPFWDGRDASGNPIDTPHSDGFQGQGAMQLTLMRSKLLTRPAVNPAPGAGDNSAVFLDGIAGVESGNCLIQDNYVAGGNFVLWIGLGPHNVLRGNRVGRDYWTNGGRYGPVRLAAPANVVWENNTWADTGQPLSKP